MVGTLPNLINATILHLENVSKSPSTPLDQSLLEDCKLAVDRLDPDARRNIAFKLSILLESLQQDPTPAIDLLKNILEPYSFSEIQNINPDIDYTAGLALGAAPYNDLTVALLRKSTHHSADAESVAGSQGILLALVRLWLQTPNAKTASQAEDLLLDLLKADREPPRVFEDDLSVKSSYLGAVWRRLFGDRDIYELLFTSCALRSDIGAEPGDLRQISLAQGRLLSWLPKVADLKWNTLLDCHHQEVESRFQSSRSYGGILRFAAVCMVDKTDILMHMLLIDFCCALLKIQPRDDMITMPLEFLTSLGLHHEAFQNYLGDTATSSPIEDLIYQASARYVATFVEFHASNFLHEGNEYRSSVLDHLCRVFLSKKENVEADLHVLASLPRTMLVDGIDPYDKERSPISALLNLTFNEYIFNAISTIIRGAATDLDSNNDYSLLSSEKSRECLLDDATAARTIYFVVNSDPSFWTKVVQSARTLSLDKIALAAISFMRSVATASWPNPKMYNPSAHTPSRVSSLPLSQNIRTVPNLSGAEVLCYTPANNYLLSPYASYHHTRNSIYSAEYRIGMAKYEALKIWVERLKAAVGQVAEADGTDGETVTARSRKKQLDEKIRAGERAIALGPFASVAGGAKARAV